MYDVSKEFRKFYKNHVVLQSDKQQKLREKKDVNIKRLKDGLALYNQENDTSYAIAETRVQGSMAMATVVQNDENDCDIDVAIVFDKSNIGNLSPLQARRLVRDALEKKCGQLKEPPECKTNCVRIQYADNYHVDFAVYRRFKTEGSTEYSYEHSGGSNWTARDPAAITKWFQDEVKAKGTELRQVVRLSKMFCKSRSSWVNMPGGLIQSVLCDEVFASEYDRLDEIFYYTMLNIKDRLEKTVEVYNPTDPEISLLSAQNHYDKMNNWLSRLSNKLEKLSVLEDDDCTYKEAVAAWEEFFKHNFWTELTESLCEYASIQKSVFTDTEEYIEDLVPINDCYHVDIRCQVEAKGIRKQFLSRFLEAYPQFYRLIPHGMKLHFEAVTDVPNPDAIWWKVRNVGEIAERKNEIRGQIEKKWWNYKTEDTMFGGPHFVECYVIKNGECVAMQWIQVHIGEASI